MLSERVQVKHHVVPNQHACTAVDNRILYNRNMSISSLCI